jgi:hypothetical protein
MLIHVMFEDGMENQNRDLRKLEEEAATGVKL